MVVLGASGFIGRNLVAMLSAAGIESLAVYSSNLDLSSPHAARELSQLLRSTDAVVFLAATRLGLRLDNEGFVRNVAMGAAVCQAVADVGISHLVYLSSDSVYPFASHDIDESFAPAPTSLYGIMHIARETMLRKLSDLPVATLRVSQIYGPGDPHSAYGPRRMVRSAMSDGRIVVYGTGEETRDHIYVDDVADLILQTLKRRSSGVVNVATGRSTSFSDLAGRIARLCGGAVSLVREPARMPVMHRKFDVSALNAAFPTRSDTLLDDGLKLLIEAEKRAFTGSMPKATALANVGLGPDAGYSRVDSHTEVEQRRNSRRDIPTDGST